MRCRVSGESVRFDESMTILRRDLTSATEITSSLTTAAIRVSVIWPPGGCATGACGAEAAADDPGPEGARAGIAGLGKPLNPTSSAPSQRITTIDNGPRRSIT